jgi:TRAP transporter TAXI family solute receptor
MRWIRNLSLSVAMTAAASLASAQNVGVGTMSQGTISFTTGSVIAKVMKEKMGIETRVQPNSGESVLVPLINNGEIDFGIANVLESQQAFAGQGSFAGRPQPNLRIAAVLYPLRTAYFVRADSDIKSLADLKGKRVTVGFSAMGTVDIIAKALLATGGLKDGDYRPVLVPNVVAGADQLQNGRADAFFFAVGAAKVAEVNAAVPLRILPMPADEAAVARMRALFADGYPSTIQPGANFAGVSQPTVTLGYDNILLTNSRVSGELVTKVVSGLASNREALIEGFPQFRGLDPKQMVKPQLATPHHPASLEWAKTVR